MNRQRIASALMSAVLITAAGTALAQAGRTSDAYPEGSQLAWIAQTSSASPASHVSREKVREELAEARAQGLIPQNDYEYPAFADRASASTKTRAQVYEELIRARESGEMRHSNP
ncbi:MULTISPECIES: DUF4148 domain-containing protein [Pandoraea]|jgi:hypothetical protein|uniref:DUF4148 domain-containing protein n=1 Tax=Pandoraea TaxID=93217 RepID=UPI0003C74AF9|nr:MULTISPECIES: DUF4148 domain-containing protein [Pandoraea]AHB77639.1 hypothetical protein X636_21095 [Pandoraea pnomenusa]AHN74073.1 hypothetical protein DA70_05995 [Pandoraea pnomenusa]MBN9096022.1 DUF4148 domain-containing protein [Pandoraea pnomenusa]